MGPLTQRFVVELLSKTDSFPMHNARTCEITFPDARDSGGQGVEERRTPLALGLGA